MKNQPNQRINADGKNAGGLTGKFGWPAGYAKRWPTSVDSKF